jgi:hypothetical protein
MPDHRKHKKPPAGHISTFDLNLYLDAKNGWFRIPAPITAIPGRAHVPITSATGFGRPEDVERARVAGFYSHITSRLIFRR